MSSKSLWVVFIAIAGLIFQRGASGAETHLRILYGGDMRGYVEGCGCKGAQGGLARRAGLIKELRAKNESVISLEGGDAYSSEKNVPELRAETMVKGLNLMKYDAWNIAEGELSLGLRFFDDLEKTSRVPFLSANISKDRKETLGQPYILIKLKKFNVGITGLVSPSYFKPAFLTKENIVVRNPQDALKEIMPELRAKADLIILLSELGMGGTEDLVKKVPGVDVAIVGHDVGVMQIPVVKAKTILVQNNLQGKFLGMLDLVLSSKGVNLGGESKLLPITRETPSDEEVNSLLRQFGEKKAAADRTMADEAKKQAMKKKLREGLNMTPEEFLEKMEKEGKLISPNQVPSTNNQNKGN